MHIQCYFTIYTRGYLSNSGEILLILPKFHEKTTSRSGSIEKNRPGGFVPPTLYVQGLNSG